MSRPTMLICMGRLLWGSVYRPSVIARRCRYRAVHPIIGRLRDELLNETLFRSLPHARAALQAWRRDYNEARPHSKLGWMTPRDYARAIGGDAGRGAALRHGSAPRPLATNQTPGSNQPRTLLCLDEKRGSRQCAPACRLNPTA